MRDLFIVRQYEYAGIKVIVAINFERGTISLVDNSFSHNNKKWVFAERQLEYMQSWQNILDAMKYALSEATEVLKDYKDERDLEIALSIAEEVNEINKLTKKEGKRK